MDGERGRKAAVSGRYAKKSRHREEEWDKSHKGKGEISLKRSKLNQSIQFSSVAIFSESALDRDYIGNSARKSERGRETQRENGKREGCWPTLNGNSNTAPESAKQRGKKEELKRRTRWQELLATRGFSTKFKFGNNSTRDSAVLHWPLFKSSSLKSSNFYRISRDCCSNHHHSPPSQFVSLWL